MDPRLRALNAEEDEALKKLRALVGDGDPVESDAALLRFLRARRGDVDKAWSMIQAWRAWRIEYNVDRITARDVASELRYGKAFFAGRDLQNRPILVVRTRRHFPDERTGGLGDTLRFAVWVMETGTKLADEAGVTQLTVIYDREGFGSKNRDRTLFQTGREMVSFLQDYYAERLGRVFVLHASTLFWMVYKVVSPLLSPETKAKICVVREGSSGPHPLLEHVAPDQLLKTYGGQREDRFEYRELVGWTELVPRPGPPLWVAGASDNRDENEPVKVRKRHTVTVNVTQAHLDAAGLADGAEVQSSDLWGDWPAR